jgi:putative transposase
MRQCKAEVYLHLVWATLNRLPLLTSDIERAVYRCIENEALRLGCNVLAIGGMPDHIHLVVKIPTRLSIASLMNQVKGVSSHFVHERLPYNEGFFWQEGYGVFSVTPGHVRSVIAYVENQKQHHSEDRVHPRWEETDEEYVPKSPDM